MEHSRAIWQSLIMPFESAVAREIARIFKIALGYAFVCVACFFMVRTSAGYLTFRGDEQFLAAKQAYLSNRIWLACFYVHVFSAFVTLFAGFTQFSSDWLRESRRLHRALGRVYVVAVLAINVPTGFVLAAFANGGLSSKIAFALLDALWFAFTLKALQTAKAKDFARHRDYMIRSYALTLSAISLRAWKIVLLGAGAVNPAHVYAVQAWIGFLPNLIVAEGLIRWPSAGMKSRPRAPGRS